MNQSWIITLCYLPLYFLIGYFLAGGLGPIAMLRNRRERKQWHEEFIKSMDEIEKQHEEMWNDVERRALEEGK